MPIPHTPNAGAAIERLAWMRKIRRTIKEGWDWKVRQVLNNLLTWGEGRVERNRARPGGLGKPCKKCCK